jgi:hypothetical protein
VLDAMTQALPRELALGAPRRVQGLLDGPIAHRVHRALEALTMRATDEVVEVVLRPVEDAAVLTVGGIWLARRGGRPAGRAVGHHLEGAQLQPLVAQSGADAGAEQSHERMLPAVDRRERVDADAQAAGVGQRLGRTERRPHEPAGVVNAGATRRDVRRVGPQERVAEIVGARHRGHLQRHLRGLVGDAEVASAVAIVASASRIGRGVVDAGGRQGASVDGADVSTRAREDHRVIGRDRVPVETVRVTLLLQA